MTAVAGDQADAIMQLLNHGAPLDSKKRKW